MRRKQFVQLISDLRAELSKSTDPAVGVSDLPQLKQTLNRVYQSLYDLYPWPFLKRVFDRIPLQAGQRYYDFPEEMDFDNMESVAVWFSGQPLHIERGIGFEEYATYDSESDVRVDPVVKWDVRSVDDTREMLEVWPVPASNSYSIQFIGKRKFEPLVDDSDLCLLDDDLVVIHAAAELLPTKGTNIQAKLAAAQARLGMLKGRSAAGSGSVRLGLGRSNRPIMGKAVVRIGG